MTIRLNHSQLPDFEICPRSFLRTQETIDATGRLMDETEYVYDGEGRKMLELPYSPDGESASISRMQYDSLAHIVLRTEKYKLEEEWASVIRSDKYEYAYEQYDEFGDCRLKITLKNGLPDQRTQGMK